MMFARCFLFLVLTQGGAEAAAFTPCTSDDDFDGTAALEDHCTGDEGFKEGTKELLDKAKCEKHGCNTKGDDGCQCGDKSNCEAYGGKWERRFCSETPAFWTHYGVKDEADVDVAKCDVKQGVTWKSSEATAKQMIAYIAGKCCKSGVPKCGLAEYVAHVYTDSACTSKSAGNNGMLDVGKVAGDALCASGEGWNAKLACTSTGASGKMTLNVYTGGTDCSGTPIGASDFDFGEYSHQDAKKFLEGGCVKHYRESVYLKLNKAAPASVIPDNFCGPTPTPANTTNTTAKASGGSASHASLQAGTFGPLIVATMGFIAHL